MDSHDDNDEDADDVTTMMTTLIATMMTRRAILRLVWREFSSKAESQVKLSPDLCFLTQDTWTFNSAFRGSITSEGYFFKALSFFFK